MGKGEYDRARFRKRYTQGICNVKVNIDIYRQANTGSECQIGRDLAKGAKVLQSLSHTHRNRNYGVLNRATI